MGNTKYLDTIVSDFRKRNMSGKGVHLVADLRPTSVLIDRS
jgi:hypothetical protein